jgi:hypothetical protein
MVGSAGAGEMLDRILADKTLVMARRLDGAFARRV